jgi:hypothetical protein
VDLSINTTAKFNDYVKRSFNTRAIPGAAKLLDRLEQLYPAVEKPGSPFNNTQDRLALFVADAGFNCHHRAVVQAYPGKTYTYQASLWNGGHYVDQFPSFFDPNGGGYNQRLKEASKTLKPLYAFMSYLVSEIVTGDPNTLRDKETTIAWPTTAGVADKTLSSVLQFSKPTGPDGFAVIVSPKLVKDRCDFWTDFWSEMDESPKS